ncbi:hypothetical protein [Streptomyces acidicola]|uniref:hypothetical protein n=1 Tax=Streptomyces acidicola TaxID=2596892 RepID=UPI00381A68BA
MTPRRPRSIVVQFEGRVLFAKLYNDPQHLDALWENCLPLLLALGVWRHVLRRVPLRYELGWWNLVFPVGM